MKRVAVALLGLGLVAAVDAARAQEVPQALYRPNMPPVLTPPAEEEEVPLGAEAIEAFRQANLRRDSPRIAVFWNRVLSDRSASRWVDEVVLWGSAEKGPGSEDVVVSVTAGARPVAQPQRYDMPEASGWEVRGAFVSTLLEGGAKLVDRATIMRLTSHAANAGGSAATTGKDDEAGNRPDAQAIETEALLGKADLLMEVLMTPDLEATAGWKFRVVVKEVRTGRIIASLATDAALEDWNDTEYVATSHGFEPTPVSRVEFDKVGRRLALETMAALSKAL